jgi:hypothetical protein
LGASYYLPAILADEMAAAIGVSRTWVFGAFSASLLLSAALGPAVGRMMKGKPRLWAAGDRAVRSSLRTDVLDASYERKAVMIENPELRARRSRGPSSRG